MDGVLTGLAFFLVQRVPMRSSYIDKIHANGGRVVKLEAQADHILADHMRRDAPPGSISYTFIDAALRSGTLPEPEEHAAGPTKGTIRDVGGVVPGKSTKTPFTKEDDRELWMWVEQARRKGGQVKGNDIYKQLESRNSRHTFQAWRDRYIKKLIDRPPDGIDVDGGQDELEQNGYVKPDHGGRKRKVEISVEAESAGFKLPKASQSASPKRRKVAGIDDEAGNDQDNSQEISEPNDNIFGKEEFDALMEAADGLDYVDPDQEETAWQAWADAMKEKLDKPHSAAAWRAYWEAEVEPEYRRKKSAEKKKRRKRREARRSAASSRSGSKAVDSDMDTVAEKARSSSTPKRVDERDVRKRERRTATPTSAAANGSTGRAAYWQETVDAGLESSKDSRSALAQNSIHSSAFNGISTQPIELLSDDDDGMDRHGGREPGQLNGHGDSTEFDSAQRAKDINSARTSDSLISEANLKAGQQLRQEIGETPKRSDLPTSEMDHEAVAQLRRGLLHDARRSDLVTSDANRAAEQQVRQDALKGEDDDEITPEDAADEYNDEPAQDSIVISTHLLEHGSVEDGLPGEELIDPSVSAKDDPSGPEPIEREDSGDRLTEANLASQQAEHRAQLMRGMDLPADDETMDQSSYAEYLQGLVSHKQAAPRLEADAMPGRVQKAADLPQDDPSKSHSQSSSAAALQDLIPNLANGTTKAACIMSIGIRKPVPVGSEARNGLPLSSQQEIDDILEDNLQWPASPQQCKKPTSRSQRLDEGQGVRLEKQTQYAVLPYADEEQDHADMFTTQPGLPPAVHYPTLPDNGVGNIQHGLLLPPQKAASRLEGQVGIDQDADRDEQRANDAANSTRQDDVDLTLAEPEDGFSSPVKDQTREEQLKSADDEFDFGLAEPDGGSSSPIKDVQAARGERDQDQLEADHDSQQIAGQDLVQISSAKSASPLHAVFQPASSPPPHGRINGRRGLETQDIMEAETQQVDLSMLLPPDTDDEDEEAQRDGKEEEEEALPSESFRVASPPNRSQPTRLTQAQTAPRPSLTPPAQQRSGASKGKQKAQPNLTESQSFDDEDIDSWIAKMGVRYKIPASREDLIEDALYATSTRPDLAEIALLSMLAGNGLPNDLPGVWTVGEDRGCEGGDARVIKRLMQKHGDEEYYARLEWLKGWRDG